jgi:hypothetical protein
VESDLLDIAPTLPAGEPIDQQAPDCERRFLHVRERVGGRAHRAVSLMSGLLKVSGNSRVEARDRE